MPHTEPPGEADVPRSVGRVLDLFEIVHAAGECNLSTAAERAGLTPTTARRHLRALEVRGYVRRDDVGVYTVGPTMARIAATVDGADPLARLISTAQPHLDALATATGESTYLAIGDGRVATYVASAESPRAIRHVGWIGQNVTLDGTAVGAAIAEPGRCAVRSGAVEPDITAISRALPIDSPNAAAISIIGPSHRFTDLVISQHERALDDTVGAVCHLLGGALVVSA